METDDVSSTSITETITEDHIVQTEKALEEITEKATFCADLVDVLKKKIETKEISTEKGLDFLEVKNNLLLEYIINLSGLFLTKLHGKSIQGSAFIDHLLETRVVLEKIRPIEQKMKYQIEKLVRNAVDGNVETDPLRYKANPDELTAKDEDENDSNDDDDSDAEEKSSKSESNIYRPPRIAPQYFEDEEESTKLTDKIKKRVINKSLIRELQEEFLETPVEVHNMGDAYAKQLSKQTRDKQRFEETYMTRLPVTKREKHRENAASTIGVLGDELTDFVGKRHSAAVKTKGKKRKGFKSHGHSKKRMKK